MSQTISFTNKKGYKICVKKESIVIRSSKILVGHKLELVFPPGGPEVLNFGDFTSLNKRRLEYGSAAAPGTCNFR